MTNSPSWVDVLRAVAPVGTTVYVEHVSPGEVRLFVVAAGVVNHITHRVAHLLNIDSDTATDTTAAGDGIVARLSLRLHGTPDALIAADAADGWA